MSKKQGVLIVFEGIDGAGKTTQIDLLTKTLKVPYEVISFPRYGDSKYADLVKSYLEGKLGNIRDVDPYFIAKAYASDRLLAKPLIEDWLKKGKLVIANRYVSSSKAHLGANLPQGRHKDFFKWVDKLEYETNKMPSEDLIILLAIDPSLGQKNAQYEHKSDIHEKSLKHLEEANKIYLKLAKDDSSWYVVDCMRDGKMKTKEDINRQILKILAKYIHEYEN